MMKNRRVISPFTSGGESFHIYYALGIGVYRQSYSYDWIGREGNSYTLVHAKINGKEYGKYVNVEDEDIIPRECALFQNYPNPFNPTTNIEYQISAPGIVTLKVYDILGREVSALVDEYKLAGTYKSNFNASGLATGVYFYQLKAGGFVQTKKLIILE